jgi:hypothetical protein
VGRWLSLLVLTAIIATAPALAQRGGGRGGGGGGGFHSAMHAPSIFRGGPRGPVDWNEFHHDTAPAKVAPHRLAGTNLPRANTWRGNRHDFDLRTWQGGAWQHVAHGGRLGWWWVVGPDWYFFDTPVYPYPDLYTPAGERLGWWYWCDAYNEYYPYVTYCPVSWESVMPME